MWRCGSSSPAARLAVSELTGPRSCCAASARRVLAGGERKRLALELLADIRRLDRDIATAKRRVSDAVTASGTSLLELHGVGPIVAGFILGHVGDPARFPTPARFASYNGTAPIEASSGPRKRHRLNPRGNRKLNHALHLAAVTQVAPRHPRPGLLPAQDRRGEVQEGSAAGPEASHQRRRLAPTPSRPRPPLTTRAREDNQGRLFNPAWPAEP